MQDADVIVIGSGAGGLTAALALAQAGKKVLVLEQHDVPGGWCHSFTLDGYRFSPGVHYVGEVQEGGRLRRILEGLGVSRDLAFTELNPDGLDHIVYGDQRFDIPRGKDIFAGRLKERFTSQSRGIDRYFEQSDRIYHELVHIERKQPGLATTLSMPFVAPTTMRWGLRTLNGFFDACGINDPALRCILAGQCGDHGLEPARASASVHASVTSHYWNGGYYPVGGGMQIPRAFTRALERHGGEVRLQTRVKKILLAKRRAVGVQLDSGRKLYAEHVISNADPTLTYRSLVGDEHLGPMLRQKLRMTRYSCSVLSLFMAVDMDLKAAGLDSGNYWYYPTTDIDACYKNFSGSRDATPGFFMTVTTLKDPSKAQKGHHTLEMFTFAPYDSFAPWENSTLSDRPAAYLQNKEHLKARMLRAAEAVVPGIGRHVVLADLGTPLTNAFYIPATVGNIYGTEKSGGQMGLNPYGVRSAFKNLWLCGASTVSHGVMGASTSGLVLASKLLGCEIDELLMQKGPPLVIYSSEDMQSWPAAYHERIRANWRVDRLAAAG